MAVIVKSDQQTYAGRGPLDSNSLVKTYAELLDESTWTKTVNGASTLVAYNYMLVAVWLNKEDTSKNGFYYLFDPNVTSALKKPDVTNPDNWHRLDQSNSIDVSAQIEALRQEIAEGYVTKEALDESKIIRIKTVAELPNTGDSTYFYLCDDGNTYVYGDGIYTKFASREVRTIDGGTAADFII